MPVDVAEKREERPEREEKLRWWGVGLFPQDPNIPQLPLLQPLFI